jgi:hypothetical protein
MDQERVKRKVAAKGRKNEKKVYIGGINVRYGGMCL